MEGEGGGDRDKRTWNEQSAITICHAGKRCDAGRAVIKYKRCARRLRNSVVLIMRFARHACERNGIRPFPDTFATYSHLLSDPYVLSLSLSLSEKIKVSRTMIVPRTKEEEEEEDNIVGMENFNGRPFKRISGKETETYFFFKSLGWKILTNISGKEIYFFFQINQRRLELRGERKIRLSSLFIRCCHEYLSSFPYSSYYCENPVAIQMRYWTEGDRKIA